MSLHVAGAQIAVTADIDRNVETIARAILYAAAVGADVLLTPEGSVSGYTPEFCAADACAAVAALTARAAKAGLGLALGTCFVEPDDGRCYNEIRFYDGDGTFLGCHTKTLRCGSLDEPPAGEIEHYGVRPLGTFSFHGTTIGGLICNDLWANPGCTPMPDTHLTQELARLGARVVFHSVNGGRDGSEWSQIAWRYHEANLQMRAAAGALWIVTVDNCAPETMPCSAPSGVVGPDGRWLCRVDATGEQFFHHVLTLD